MKKRKLTLVLLLSLCVAVYSVLKPEYGYLPYISILTSLTVLFLTQGRETLGEPVRKADVLNVSLAAIINLAAFSVLIGRWDETIQVLYVPSMYYPTFVICTVLYKVLPKTANPR